MGYVAVVGEVISSETGSTFGLLEEKGKNEEKIPPVQVEDSKKWLEVNTFECAYGRVSPEACEELRSRLTVKEYFEKKAEKKDFGQKVRLMPGVCEKCTEWERKRQEVYEKRKRYYGLAFKAEILKDVVIERREEGVVDRNNERKGEEGKGGEKRRNERGERKMKKSKKRVAGEMTEERTVVLDFSLIPDVYEKLKKRAEDEFRTVEMQILWELKKVFERGEKEEKKG